MSVFTQKDKTIYAKTYFPERNGINPDVKNGRNFDNDTLFYMSKVKVAQYIANSIETFTFNKPYFLVEICSGIGGNTLEFLSREKCATVIASERDAKRRLYLKRNITAYKFDDKAIVLDNEVMGDDEELEYFSDFKDSIFYFDPPWLPEDYKNADADYKKHYIRKGIKIGNLTLEQWLEKLRDTAYLVAFRVGPADYELGEVPGWTYHYENLGRDEARKAQAEDGKLYFCFNNKKIKGGSMDKFGGYFKSVPMLKSKLLPPSTEVAESYIKYRSICSKGSIAKAREEKCPFLRYMFVDPEPEEKVKPVSAPVEAQVEKSTKGLRFGKVPLSEQVWKFTDIPSRPKKFETGSPEWNAEFQNYLAVVLRKFIPNADIVNQLLSAENFTIWLRAFTDASYNYNPDENYESLETLGDSVIEFAFTEYLFEMLGPNVTPNDMTAYSQKYTSEEFQIYLGKSFKFGEWVLHSELVPPSEKINEDIVESFVGALYLTGNQVSSKTQLGMRLAQKFVRFYSEKLVFDDSPEKLGNDGMNVLQRFQSILGTVKEPFSINQKGALPNIQVQIIATQDTIDKVNELGIRIKPLLGYAYGTTKNNAQAKAYTDARKNLDSWGFTDSFVANLKSGKFIKQLEMSNKALANMFKTILSNKGLDPKKDIEFFKKSFEDKDDILVVMNAIQGEKRIKLAEGVAKTEYDAKVKAVKNFIEDN